MLSNVLSIMLLEKMKTLDYYIFSKINGQWHNSFFDALFTLSREAYFWAPFYLFLALFVITNFKKTGWLWVLFLILNVFLSDYLSSVVIKENFYRLRPCRDPLIADHLRFLVKSCGLNSSFTSSHAVNHFAAAMFIFATFKKNLSNWWGLVFVWALIPSYAQIYVGVHFPGDIIGGAIAGLIIGYLVAYLFNRTGLVDKNAIDT